MISDEKSKIVNSLIKLAKTSKLDIEQKKKIVEILDNMEIITETQRERFIMYYGLGVYSKERKTLIKIATIYGVTVNAVRYSITNVKNKLTRLENEFEVLEQIVNECEIKN